MTLCTTANLAQIVHYFLSLSLYLSLSPSLFPAFHYLPSLFLYPAFRSTYIIAIGAFAILHRDPAKEERGGEGGGIVATSF